MRLFPVHILFIMLISFSGWSQDIHWSHVNRQPLYQNPGNTGLFQGDIRFTGNYKDQWRQVSVPFSTIALAADGRWPLRKLSWGVMLFHDQVGDGKFKTIEFQLSVAKLIKLTSDSTHCLSGGIQAGINYRQVNMNKFYFDNQFNGVIYDPSLPTMEVFQNDSRANFTSAAGVVYTWNRQRGEHLTLGLAGFNLNRPNQGFYGQTVRRDRRLNLFGTYERALNSDWSLIPGFSFNFQGTYREFVLGSQARYTLIQKLGTYRAVDGGLWFRGRDAVIVRVGLAVQNWTFAMSYDTNISKLIPASRLRGGLELSGSYILTRFKPEKIIHRVCPDYI